MSEQRFVGKTLREVFAKVRAALGNDAIIIEQHRHSDYVEVVAATDYPKMAIPQGLGPRCTEKLDALGFDARFINELAVDSVQGNGWEDARTRLIERFTFADSKQLAHGSYRFSGPSGAGKTSTIIKVAAHAAIESPGAAHVRMVGCDRDRLAGSEALALAAQLLDIEYVECEASAIPTHMLSSGPGELTLIDTSGSLAPRQRLPGVRDVWVMPAMWQAKALAQAAQRGQAQRCQGLVFTHLDLTHEIGPMLRLAMQWQLPVLWLASGSMLTQDLTIASRRSLTEQIERCVDQSRITSTFV